MAAQVEAGEVEGFQRVERRVRKMGEKKTVENANQAVETDKIATVSPNSELFSSIGEAPTAPVSPPTVYEEDEEMMCRDGSEEDEKRQAESENDDGEDVGLIRRPTKTQRTLPQGEAALSPQ